VHVALNEYTNVVPFSFRGIRLPLCLPRENTLQVQGLKPAGILDPIQSRSCDPLFKIVVKKVLALLGEMSKAMD
jgi:hypothetical protein